MKRLMCFIAVAGLVFAESAMADLVGTVYMRHSGVSPYTSMTLWGDGFNGLGGVEAGTYHQDVSNTSIYTSENMKNKVPNWGFCIEMQYSSGSWLKYDVLTLDQAPMPVTAYGTPMGTTTANYIRELWAEHINDVTDATTAAAFQISIWEIVYEHSEGWNVLTRIESADPATMGFKVTGPTAVTSLANNMAPRCRRCRGKPCAGSGCVVTH